MNRNYEEQTIILPVPWLRDKYNFYVSTWLELNKYITFNDVFCTCVGFIDGNKTMVVEDLIFGELEYLDLDPLAFGKLLDTINDGTPLDDFIKAMIEDTTTLYENYLGGFIDSIVLDICMRRSIIMVEVIDNQQSIDV